MNKINIEIDCGIVTLSMEARTNDPLMVKEQIDRFLDLGNNLWDDERCPTTKE